MMSHKEWFLVCVAITCLVVAARGFLITRFEGVTLMYWGDFLFVFLLAAMSIWYGLTVLEFVAVASGLLLFRFMLQAVAPSRYKDMSERPKDVVIVFKRFESGPDPYDITQIGSFVLLVFLALYYKDAALRFIRGA